MNIIIAIYVIKQLMKSYLKIVLFLWIIATINSKVFASNIFWFNTFLNDIETVEKEKNNINIFSYVDQTKELEKEKCIIQNYENYSYISPVCLIKNTNYLTTEKALQYITENLNKFYDVYQQDSFYFRYKPTRPNFYYSNYHRYLENRWTIYEKIAILYWTSKDRMIKIDNEILSKLMYENYSFYSVPTNLANRWPCSLTNYKLAISKLNWLELKPWEVLDLNKLITNDPHSCKWNSTKSFLFYGWSCWASSQLFRLALIMPDLTVLERAWHAKRRALYYWSNIMWDDAAMYENSKKFVIRNDFDTSIYFTTYEKWNYVYLVWIVPEKIDEYVEIIKNVNWYRSSLFKQIYNKYWTLIWSYQFDSVYSSLHRWKS